MILNGKNVQLDDMVDAPSAISAESISSSSLVASLAPGRSVLPRLPAVPLRRRRRRDDDDDDALAARKLPLSSSSPLPALSSSSSSAENSSADVCCRRYASTARGR